LAILHKRNEQHVTSSQILGLACVMSPLQLRYSLIPGTMFHWNWFM
jgi:hypothetical protein